MSKSMAGKKQARKASKGSAVGVAKAPARKGRSATSATTWCSVGARNKSGLYSIERNQALWRMFAQPGL